MYPRSHLLFHSKTFSYTYKTGGTLLTFKMLVHLILFFYLAIINEASSNAKVVCKDRDMDPEIRKLEK